MTFQELQEQHKPWSEHNFPNAKRWEPLVGMQEELGELSHAFLKLHQGIRINEDHQGGMADAVGDVIIYAADFCNRNGIDMQKAVEEAWASVSHRDWKNNKENGLDPQVSCENFGGQYIWTQGKGDDVKRMNDTQEGIFQRIGRELGDLVEKKNRAYGDSFGRSGVVLRELYPNGIGPDQIDDALCIVRIVDKLFRIATHKEAFGENPFQDIAGYGLLGMARSEERK